MSDNFVSELNKLYTQDKLLYLYRNYLEKMEKVIPKYFSFYKDIINPNTNKYDKSYLLELLRIIYTDRELFNKFLTMLDSDFQKIFSIIVTVTSINQNDLSVKIGQRVNFSLNSANRFEILAYLFEVKDHDIYSFSLPEMISEKLLPHFGITQDIKFENNQLESDLFIYEDKDNIIKNLRNYYSCLNSLDINLNNKGLIESKTIDKIKKTFEIKEFYDSKDKKLNSIKAKLIFNFLNSVPNSELSEPLLILRQNFKNYKDYKTKFFTYPLLEHLSFPKNFLESNKDKVKNNNFQTSMLDLLLKIPVNQWISFEQIVELIETNDLQLKLISENYADNTSFKNNMELKQNVSNPRIYKQAITIPAIKATMFLFASFGLLDLAYYLPEIKPEAKNYLSAYDGLKYIKLTNLGEYIIGKAENYITSLTSDEKITLNSKNLIIKLNRKSNFKSFLIKKFAEEIDSLNFKVTYKSFLADCKTKSDIQEKIEEFKNKISSQTSDVWEDFFGQLVLKSEAINQTSNFIVFQIDKDKNLLELLSKDYFLKKSIIRAESYKILVESNNVDGVRERLKEFGYFI